MTVPLGELELRYTSGAITTSLTIDRARIDGLEETYDLSALRAPFGVDTHAVGTGRRLPSIANISGVLEGATPADSDDQLATLKTALATVTQIRVQNLELDVLCATGPFTRTPTLRGWRVAFQLETTADWEL